MSCERLIENVVKALHVFPTFSFRPPTYHFRGNANAAVACEILPVGVTSLS